MARILYVTSSTADYLCVSLLHGLREVLGDQVVDHPRCEPLYSDAGESVRDRAYGRGFTVFFRQDDPSVDRDEVWYRALDGEFDLVVFGDINRSWGQFAEWGIQLIGKTPVALVDGADSPALYPKGPMWWRRPAWWFLPRSHRADFRFKRELGPWTYRTGVYGLLPAAIARHLPSLSRIKPISFAIPSDNLVDDVPVKSQRFPAHIVDEEVAARIGATSSYAFDTESDYYADLRKSRFGITIKRAGWDCMRHYELAASGTIPCFRNLAAKPSTCAPHGLIDGVNCIDYNDADDLFAKLDALDEGTEQRLAAGALEWARQNTTEVLATKFLRECGISVAEVLARESVTA